MANEYVDITSFVPANDLNDAPVETGDYADYPLIPVGVRVSNQRKAEVNEKPDGNLTIKLTFLDGLVGEDGDVQGVGDCKYISTKQYVRKGHPGKTSSAARYLDKCGIDPKGKTAAETVELIANSLDIPVKIKIDWEDKVEGVKGTDGKWSYPKATLRTKDFNLGTPWEPNYVNKVMVNGKEYQARHVFGDFEKA